MNYQAIHSILSNKKFRTTWGEIRGERYTRFPRTYDMGQKGAEYLWCKEFYLSQEFSREDVKSAGFQKKIVRDLKMVVPFLQWVRETVGTAKVFKKGREVESGDW
ncbi:MAG TPA: DUF2461 family protein [Bacteriovoracaceae bacterium]|nr:DUF2461 family protein [Bacteriovoracaceae bacterium]